MTTPIAEFLRCYQREGMSRFHMPGHKGEGPLGCESWDLTEIDGADSLYEASGIIAESEQNAAALFGSGATCYSTEGSSQCIRAMLYLALLHRPEGAPRVIAAARNVHKAYVYAAALLDFETLWLWPEETDSLCACPVTPESLDRALSAMEAPPAAVYVTSPDYLGNLADIRGLSSVCHTRGTRLLVDNAHGAYLRFLEQSLHPLDLGADLCCDSAHKTLPVLTGGAYLHIAKGLPMEFREDAKKALALFGSTSPSYLTMASLDFCNRSLSGKEPGRIRTAAGRMLELKRRLSGKGWRLAGEEPLKLTVAAPEGWTGHALSELLRASGVETEYADRDYVVLMASGTTDEEDFRIAANAFDCIKPEGGHSRPVLPLAKGERVLSVREALFAPHETIPAEASLGRVCGAPAVSCPPAIPVVVTGERISREAMELFRYYGVETVDVLRECRSENGLKLE